jgi:hypothetical protein
VAGVFKIVAVNVDDHDARVACGARDGRSLGRIVFDYLNDRAQWGSFRLTLLRCGPNLRGI